MTVSEKENTTPSDAGAENYDFDADAMVVRLKRNAAISLVAILVVTAVIWREPMAVVGALLGGALVMLNFIFLERLTARLLSASKPAANPLQLVFLAFRAVLMALILYGIFALPGVHPIPVALGLSILVLAIVIEMFSEVLSAPTPSS
jgi:hypothetical protein